MSLSIFLLWLVSMPLFAHSLPDPKGFLLNCGASNEITSSNLKYIPDEGFISVGNKSFVNTPNLLPILSTLRYFPDKQARKYCYVFPVIKGGRYLIKTTYYYGGFDGGNEPPVFDQIIQGTKWNIVNTKDDYANGMSSYYEIVVAAAGTTLSVCLARNAQTVSSPFISALEVESLDDSVYNSTDFTKYALSTVARSFFGSDGDMISFPDDPFNRLWQPFKDENPSVMSQTSINPSDFWNLPPKKALAAAINQSRNKTLLLKWPAMSLPSTKYYIALYFQDHRPRYPTNWRVFNVSVNGQNFYSNLNVTTNGVTVYSSQWPLSGQTEIILTPASNMPVGPLINAAEVLQILPIGGRTQTRDVMAMEDLARNLDNPPADWSGDPCLPHENSWTGVTCSSDKFARVVTVNLTSYGLSGSLPPTIANLTGLTNLWLGGNQLSGTIPEMGTLKKLETLHLENNEFEKSIPQSLGQLPKIREIFVQNNKLDGKMPQSLQNRNDINLQ
ncbi:LRR_4 domain-containing protein/Malectin_like domain-containing protein [Cephalotus follicularis]|uniref:LRR_4 domain-containing protein/Malectin_like domain-containing protein n=1 Tax=Cephalotus follicularis TaxID=3775 RepID=A0A1Q3DIV9_CEPFO|nr:LRR_4 domain-containing protein/Malectin_like domain-containing protein [Cephalotus follicularis]